MRIPFGAASAWSPDRAQVVGMPGRERYRPAPDSADRAGTGLPTRAALLTNPDADRGTPADTINEAIDAEY